MFLTDDITVIVAGIVLALSVVSPFVNVLMAKVRMPGKDFGQTDNEATAEGACDTTADNGGRMPGISVVLTVDDDGEQLRQNLPLLLGQDYEGDYQVVVVETGKDELVQNILKSNANDNRLYTTFIPASSRYMSRRKLAVTVGVKAAKYEWVLLTDVDCRPDSEHWLTAMSKKCRPGTDIVMGCCRFEDDYKVSRRFDYAYCMYRQLAGAQRGNARAYAGCNLMFRKDMFINGKGFDGNLKYIRGEYDFIVNKFANESNTAVELSPDSWLTQSWLSDKGWKNKRMYYMATRKELHGVAPYRMFFNVTMLMMAMTYMSVISAGVFAALTERWVLLGVAVAAMLVSILLRCVMMGRSIHGWLNGVSYVKLWWLELMMPLRNMCAMIRYKMTDKYDFICHKV